LVDKLKLQGNAERSNQDPSRQTTSGCDYQRKDNFVVENRQCEHHRRKPYFLPRRQARYRQKVKRTGLACLRFPAAYRMHQQLICYPHRYVVLKTDRC